MFCQRKRATFAFGAPATSWSCPTRDISWNNQFHCTSFDTCNHVFLRPNRRSILKPVVGHASETGTSIQHNTYVAPRSRAPAVSRAIGNGGGLQTYSRIPLHLRGKAPGAADAVIDSTKSKHANIANREKISTDQTVRKTRVGRIIQTPARFVQMVHAIVAHNDIYGGHNRIHRINNVFKL